MHDPSVRQKRAFCVRDSFMPKISEVLGEIFAELSAFIAVLLTSCSRPCFDCFGSEFTLLSLFLNSFFALSASFGFRESVIPIRSLFAPSSAPDLPSVCLSTYLSTYLSLRLSSCLSIHLSVCVRPSGHPCSRPSPYVPPPGHPSAY